MTPVYNMKEIPIYIPNKGVNNENTKSIACATPKNCTFKFTVTTKKYYFSLYSLTFLSS